MTSDGYYTLEFQTRQEEPADGRGGKEQLGGSEDNEMVGTRGFEPPTLASRTLCSTRLSHVPTRVTASKDAEKNAINFSASLYEMLMYCYLLNE